MAQDLFDKVWARLHLPGTEHAAAAAAAAASTPAAAVEEVASRNETMADDTAMTDDAIPKQPEDSSDQPVVQAV